MFIPVRNFIVEVIIAIASDEVTFRREKSYLSKLNLVLVQILKQEWPHNWPLFIPEIVSSSKNNINLCENNLIILRLLSEEIFDFSAEQMCALCSNILIADLIWSKRILQDASQDQESQKSDVWRIW